MRSRILAVSLLVFSGCNAATVQPAQNQLREANGSTAGNTGGSGAAPVAGAEAARSEWRYDTRNDPMSDRAIRTACVWSSNEAVLGFPYGNTRAELCLRDSPQYGHDAYVALEGDGQILCYAYSNCTVHVRFDDEAALSFSGGGASDNSTNIVFIRGRDRLERGLRSADRTAIQVEFYQAGQQALVFPTAGFDWQAHGGSSAARSSR